MPGKVRSQKFRWPRYGRSTNLGSSNPCTPQGLCRKGDNPILPTPLSCQRFTFWDPNKKWTKHGTPKGCKVDSLPRGSKYLGMHLTIFILRGYLDPRGLEQRSLSASTTRPFYERNAWGLAPVDSQRHLRARARLGPALAQPQGRRSFEGNGMLRVVYE